MSSTPEKMQGAMQQKSNTKADDMVVQAQSPDGDEAHMDREGADAQAQGLGYEFEVKEQDRWLPIANGAYSLPCPPGVACFARRRPLLHVDASLLDASFPSNRAPDKSLRRSAACPVCREPLTAAAYLSNAALQRPPCRPRRHIPPRPRHKQRPRTQTTPPRPQMLTFAILLQSPAS